MVTLQEMAAYFSFCPQGTSPNRPPFLMVYSLLSLYRILPPIFYLFKIVPIIGHAVPNIRNATSTGARKLHVESSVHARQVKPTDHSHKANIFWCYGHKFWILVDCHRGVFHVLNYPCMEFLYLGTPVSTFEYQNAFP